MARSVVEHHIRTTRATGSGPPSGVREAWEQQGMSRFWKAILMLLVLGLIGLVGFAYFGDLTPETEDVSQPVTLDVD
jgi:hypothetical protein